ncbi:MAG: TlyA family RNA methyltransferase, partial [Lachnospiraceae bacterium]|nr:TlyA family RNA methyltransferase [bacterium]MDY5518519.1 TlyA family RNA methyltransferase [Lachnospiraceae bacterium]
TVIAFARSIGFSILHLEFSPIKGPEGNIEYLVHLKKDGQGALAEEISPERTVEEAHGLLDKPEKA